MGLTLEAEQRMEKVGLVERLCYLADCSATL